VSPISFTLAARGTTGGKETNQKEGGEQKQNLCLSVVGVMGEGGVHRKGKGRRRKKESILNSKL